MVNQQRECDEPDHMSPRQNGLLRRLGQTLLALAHECEEDEAFHNVMTLHNDLIPLSLDELACEWFALAEGERQQPSPVPALAPEGDYTANVTSPHMTSSDATRIASDPDEQEGATMVNENPHSEVVIRRWHEADVRFTAIVRAPADGEQTLYGTATRADGTLIGSYYPAGLARQNDWHVVPSQGEPFPVHSEPDAVRALSSFSERLV